ncbi:periplasmic heavy metal sensor [Lyngbya aestuarii]|uniref:periplasmic heavy metal sensor n=1 Tax=Lyngbya aestuarii TaxID=118322 RepID=UPI00403DA6C2
MSFPRISVMSAFLLAAGCLAALADPNPLLPQTIEQNLGTPGNSQAQPRLTEELNLTPEQKQELQDIRFSRQDQIDQKQQALRQANQELHQLMSSPTSTKEMLSAKYQEVQNLERQMENSRFDALLAMREVLTVEQRSLFAQLMRENRQNMRNQRSNSTE